MHEVVLDAPAKSSWSNRWPLVLVVLAALVLAGQLFVLSARQADDAWWFMTHDRHAHLLTGFNLALDVREFDLPRLRHDLNAMRVWGPLQPMVGFLVHLTLGLDHRLGGLPSLAGWVASLCLAFLLARRMLPEHGHFAGIVAAAVLAAIPACRAYATDVMLESLGLALTLLVLYCYLATVQGAWRGGAALALALIALFFHKYNYWLIVVLGLVLAECLRRPAAWFAFAREHAPSLRAKLIGEIRQPLSWTALAFFAAAMYVWVRHGTTLSLGSFQARLREPHTLFSLGFVALFLRLFLWWRREGRTLSQQLDPRVRPVLVWHGWAMAVWFLIPKRLGFFLWYISPANSSREIRSTTLLDGFHYYLAALREDYCVWSWQFGVFLALIGLAVVVSRKLRPGSVAVFTVFAISALLTMQHPMMKHRHAHTWAGLGWVLAAVGLFAALPLLGKRAASWSAAAIALLVVGLHSPAYFVPGHAQESGAKPQYTRPVSITQAYLPSLADANHSTILSNVPARFLFAWTFIEAHRHARFAVDIRQFKEEYERDPARLREWLERTPSDALVLVEVLPHSPYIAEMSAESKDLTTLKQVLRQQSAFRPANRWDLPHGVQVVLWARDSVASRIGPTGTVSAPSE